MNRFILILVVLSWPGRTVYAQLVPNSNQAFQLAPAYNPAFTGIENFTSARLGYRSQWASFPGAPRYVNMVVHGRLVNPADVTHHAFKTGRAFDENEIPRWKRMIHGLGASFIHESAGGFLESLEGGVMYSAHYPLGKGTYMAAGVSAHYGSTRIRTDKLTFKDPDQLVEAAGGSGYSGMNVRAGLLVYSPRLYVHAAYLQVYTNSKSDVLSADLRYRYRMSGGVGVRFDLSEATELRPGVAVWVDEFDNKILDYSLKLYFGNRAWGGLSYRDSGFAAVILGFELNSLVGISYSYEISTGGLQGFNSGSNEFMLGLKLANLQKLNPYVW